jgi:hypothetical protein
MASDDDSQKSREEELQAALEGLFDTGISLMQSSNTCCALERCTFARLGLRNNKNEPDYPLVGDSRCLACGFHPHEACFMGFSKNAGIEFSVDVGGGRLSRFPTDRIGFCLACLDLQKEVIVPPMGQHFNDKDWPVLSHHFERELRQFQPICEVLDPEKYKDAILKQIQNRTEDDRDYKESKESHEEEDYIDEEEDDEDEEDIWEDVDEEDDEQDDPLLYDSTPEKKRYVL